MKKLQCPKCGKILESIERYTHCVEYADVSITEDGKDVETNVYNDSYDMSVYRCQECLHENGLESFIVDSEPCEHNPAQVNGKYFEYGQETSQRYTECTICKRILNVDA